ncbi:MAG: hypothetical protein GY731_02675, partial [Gammaproteobacteria bacterium]|nr:hypothetical protein [Gammaproteobacteria bacterium]
MNKPTNLNRRQFLKRTGIVLGGGIVAASVPIIYQANTPRDIGPAYRYWEQKQKGGLTDQEYIVMCATLAANPHNTQPWKFKIASDRIELFADRERNLGAADATRRMMQMGIGCAIENMHVAAKKLGYRLTIKDMDADQRFSTDGHCATLQLEKGTPGMHPWFEPLFRRQTVRSIYDTAAPPKRLIDTLAAQADLPGLKLIVQRSSPQLEAINNLNREAVRLFVADNKQYRAAMQWFRISRDEWIEKRDGIAIYTSTAPYLIKQAINYTVSPEDLYLDDFKQGEIDSVDTVAPATPLWGLLVG